MRWLDKLERHFGFLAIPHLIIGVILAQVLATLMSLGNPQISLLLALDPAAVETGQYYRLLTWIVVPPTSHFGFIMAIFWFQMLFMMGQALDAEWGAFKSTVYLLIGILVPSLGAFFFWHFYHIALFISGWYFSSTLMLAFAALMPEFTMLLMFILPIKMRWYAWALGAYLLYSAATGGVPGALEVLLGTTNYLLFFLPAGIHTWRSARQMQVHRTVVKAAERVLVARQCSICGLGPHEADLRICHCARCGDDGQTFCIDHLQEHLPKAVPENIGKSPRPKQKRKS